MSKYKTSHRFLLLCLFFLFFFSFSQPVSLKIAGDEGSGFRLYIYNGRHLVVTNEEEFSLELFNLDLSRDANVHRKGQKWTGNDRNITLSKQLFPEKYIYHFSLLTKTKASFS